MTIADIERVWIDIDEAAHILHVHPSSVRRLRQDGRIHQRYVGSRAFFRRDEIERFALTYSGKPGRPAQRRML